MEDGYMLERRYCNDSGKRRYGSVREARACCRNVSNRLRVYPCAGCGGYHVADADKGAKAEVWR